MNGSPRPLLLRPGGWTWGATGTALASVGLWLGSNPLTLIGLTLLVCWGINVYLSGQQVAGLSAQRWISGPLFAGTTSAVEIELTTPGGDRPALVVEDQGLEES